MLNEDFFTEALCAGHPDPDLWFRFGEWRQAKLLCAGCPVKDQCLTAALDYETTDYLRRLANEDGRGTAVLTDGVWGGQNAAERKRTIEERIRVGIAA